MTEAIIALVLVLLAGCGFLAFRYRSDRGIESGISSFRRELRALAPRHGDGAPIADPGPRILRDPVPPPGESRPSDATVARDAADDDAEGDGPAGTES